MRVLVDLGVVRDQGEGIRRMFAEIDNARLREISGLDTLGASALLRRLRDRGLLTLHAAGAANFHELGPTTRGPADAPGSIGSTRGFGPDAQGFGLDTRGLDVDAQGSATDANALLVALSDEVRSAIAELGTRPAAPRLRRVVVEVCASGWWTPRQLAAVLGLKDAANLSRKHLGPLVEEGKLERRFPENPAHPRQAYRAVAAPGAGS